MTTDHTHARPDHVPSWRPGVLLLTLLASAVPAEADPPPRPRTTVTGGMTAIVQAADAADADASMTASVDLLVRRAGPRGALEIYAEATTTPGADGVASRFPVANGDAGTALDRDGRGRFQVSEVKYDWVLPGDRRLAMGLVDLAAYLDTTRINNDENLQFISSWMINNPVIELPDYTPALVFRQPPGPRRPELTVALSASNGLADNPDASYSELLDLGTDGKGLFAAIESGWAGERQRYTLGAWVNGRGDDNSGIWVTAGRARGAHAVDLRFGLANDAVSNGSGFASLAYGFERGATTIGAALAGLRASSELADAEDAALLELYVSRRLGNRWYVTPVLQRLWNPDLRATPDDDRVTVAGLRVHRTF